MAQVSLTHSASSRAVPPHTILIKRQKSKQVLRIGHFQQQKALDLQLLHLLEEPLLGLGNGLAKLRGLSTGALPRGLLSARLAANDLANGASPLLGGDTLG